MCNLFAAPSAPNVCPTTRPLRSSSFIPGQITQLVGVLSVHQKIAGSIPGQGTYPGFRFDLLSGHVQEGSWQEGRRQHVQEGEISPS